MGHKEQVKDELVRLGVNPETADSIMSTYYAFCLQNERNPKKLAMYIVGLIQQMNFIAVKDYGKYL